jgi:GDP-D-mannose 3',5'-epimerase
VCAVLSCPVLSAPQKLPIKHIPGPEGVRGRNSDNTLILEKLGWQPTVSLKDGLRMTYFWIKGQLDAEIKQRGADATAAYATSTVCKTGAPTELGTLRKADGDEGFVDVVKTAVKA